MVTSALGDRLRQHRAYMVIAHIPTGVWLLSSLCDALALLSGANFFVRLAQALQVAGVVNTLGLHLLRPTATPTPSLTPAERDLSNVHEWVNNALPTVYALSAGLRAGPALAQRRPAALPVILSLLGLVGLFLSRELTKRRTAPAGIALTERGPEFEPVAPLSELAPGTMKIVEVDNHTIALANVEGQVFAFSNICPHRDGPLAEGTLKGDIVVCPWHDSGFNVRTGAVVPGGPARRGIPTYAVRVEDDQILVQRPTKTT